MQHPDPTARHVEAPISSDLAEPPSADPAEPRSADPAAELDPMSAVAGAANAPAVAGAANAPSVELEALAQPTGPAAAATLPPRVALRRGRVIRIAIGGALAAFVALFAIVRANRSIEIDAAITLRLQRRRHPTVARVLTAVSWPGFPPQSRLISPAIIAGLWGFGLRLEAAFQLVAWSSALLSALAKAIARRPRPLHPEIDVVVAPLGGSSFPSGHVLTYIGVYGFLAYLAHTLIRPAGLRRVVVGGLVGLVGLVGPSRVHQGHHWPSDVLGSYLLGLPFLAGVITLYRRTKRRGLTTGAVRRRLQRRVGRALAWGGGARRGMNGWRRVGDRVQPALGRVRGPALSIEAAEAARLASRTTAEQAAAVAANDARSSTEPAAPSAAGVHDAGAPGVEDPPRTATS
jgi:undecaprenyl-diphosphatase